MRNASKTFGGVGLVESLREMMSKNSHLQMPYLDHLITISAIYPCPYSKNYLSTLKYHITLVLAVIIVMVIDHQ